MDFERGNRLNIYTYWAYSRWHNSDPCRHPTLVAHLMLTRRSSTPPPTSPSYSLPRPESRWGLMIIIHRVVIVMMSRKEPIRFPGIDIERWCAFFMPDADSDHPFICLLERVWIIGQLSWHKSQNWCALLTGYNVGHWYMEAIRLGGWSIRISGLYSQFNLVKMTFSSLIHTAVVEPEVYLSASALRLFQNARRWWAAFPLIYSDCRDLTDEAKIPCIVVFPPM